MDSSQCITGSVNTKKQLKTKFPKPGDVWHLLTRFLFSPSPPKKEERAGVRRYLFFGKNPLTPTLSPLGRGEGVKNRV
jgi:hypothetical protein